MTALGPRRDRQVGILATILVHAALVMVMVVRFYPAQPVTAPPASRSMTLFDVPPAPMPQPTIATPSPDVPPPRPRADPEPDPPPVRSDQGDPAPPPRLPADVRSAATSPPAPPAEVAPPPATAAVQALQDRPAADRDADFRARKTWESAVLARLEAAKRYPPAARFAHQEATIYVRFTVDRQGVVRRSDLVSPSGSPDLDQEVRALFRRVRLPPPPAMVPDRALTMMVPIEFSLQRG